MEPLNTKDRNVRLLQEPIYRPPYGLRLKKSFKPAVSYAFCVAPYTMGDIYQLDRALARIARVCCSLGRSFPTAGVLREEESGGVGLISLVVDYAQISTACLTRAVADDDRLGLVTTALLEMQRASERGSAAVEEIADEETRYYPLLRQLCVMERCGICLTQRGAVYSSSPPTPTGMTEMDIRLAALLRAQSLASSALFNPLQRIGVKHLGDLVDANGTHFITSSDLERLFGAKVGAREKRALNQLSATISGSLPSGIKTIGKLRSTGPLDMRHRALPPDLTQIPKDQQAAIRRTTGTRGIKDLFAGGRPTAGGPRPSDTPTRARPTQSPVGNARLDPIPDFQLPSHIREGRADKPPCPIVPWAATKVIRQSVHLDPTERNPDRDIDPPRQYLIQLGRQCPNGPIQDEGTAFVYRPDGKCLGTLSQACLTRLHTQYEHTMTFHPSLHRELGGSTLHKMWPSSSSATRPPRTIAASLPLSSS